MAERENDGKRLWVLFGLMNIINGGLLAYATTKNIEPGISKALIMLLGFVISIIWWATTARMSAWIEWWESKLCTLEPHMLSELKTNGSTSVPDDFTIFVSRNLNHDIGLSTKYISQLIPILFALIWLILLIDQVS